MIRHWKKFLDFPPSAYQLTVANQADYPNDDVQPANAFQLQKLASEHHQKKSILGYFFLHIDSDDFVPIWYEFEFLIFILGESEDDDMCYVHAEGDDLHERDFKERSEDYLKGAIPQVK